MGNDLTTTDNQSAGDGHFESHHTTPAPLTSKDEIRKAQKAYNKDYIKRREQILLQSVFDAMEASIPEKHPIPNKVSLLLNPYQHDEWNEAIDKFEAGLTKLRKQYINE